MPGGVSSSLLHPSLRSTSPNATQHSTDSYLQEHQQGCAKQQPLLCSLLSSFFLRQKQHTLADIGNSNVHTTIAYPHTCTYTHSYSVNYTLPWLPLFQLSAATPPPASIQHPEITAFPSGRQESRQAAEGTAMDMFCLLSNERRNVTVGLSAGPSQPSIHTCGINAVYQTAGRQLCSLLLPLSFSLYLSFFPSLSLHLYSTVCASPCLFLTTNKQRPRSALPVRLSLPPPHPPSLT